MKIVYTTIDNKEKAEEIATALVEERIAACINILQARSVYRWKDNVEKEDEFVMIIKTKENLVDEVISKIKELHTYELPVIDVIDTEVSNDVEKWLNEVTK